MGFFGLTAQNEGKLRFFYLLLKAKSIRHMKRCFYDTFLHIVYFAQRYNTFLKSIPQKKLKKFSAIKKSGPGHGPFR